MPIITKICFTISHSLKDILQWVVCLISTNTRLRTSGPRGNSCVIEILTKPGAWRGPTPSDGPPGGRMSLSANEGRASVAAGDLAGRQTASRIGYGTTALMFAAADVVAIVGINLLVSFLFSEIIDEAFDLARGLGIGIAASVAFVLTTQARGLYKPWQVTRVSDEVSAAVVNWTFAVLFVGTMIFCLKVGNETSRLATGTFAAIGFVVIPSLRWIYALWLRRSIAAGAVTGRSAIIIGDEKELAKLTADDMIFGLGLSERRRFVFPADDAPRGQGSAPDTLKSALQFARQQKVEEIVLALPWNDRARLDEVRARLRALPIPVKLLPDASISPLLNAPRVEFGNSVAIEVQRAPLSRLELTQKRALDIAVSTLALTVLLPLFATIALLIKFDSKGPVIFRQRRNGFGGREFTIFKFRSMTVMEDGAQIAQAQKNDKRVTRIGRVLRATSLDELPQVVNVLLGHMSIVGPRPHAIAHDDAYSKLISGYAFRHHVKPGITGWAQVMGLRGETAKLELMERRIEMDLWYINNWSIWLDITIILKTFIEVMRKQAY
ncbi:undecaprenyl-phosphate glucose phosphotransferase [Xanthobacter tagetidis]|uniref:Undecaprenyl-phosphate glucose phosphotransferase n=2 Tax=Xanthobacter tagetidis TaxID=60216 RepID=A0A3L7ALP9_9HYPH|nr:undecaprenyl-phosphate glucose phosphotransferase [Xanthobacter tagetidis]